MIKIEYTCCLQIDSNSSSLCSVQTARIGLSDAGMKLFLSLTCYIPVALPSWVSWGRGPYSVGLSSQVT